MCGADDRTLRASSYGAHDACRGCQVFVINRRTESRKEKRRDNGKNTRVERNCEQGRIVSNKGYHDIILIAGTVIIGENHCLATPTCLHDNFICFVDSTL